MQHLVDAAVHPLAVPRGQNDAHEVCHGRWFTILASVLPTRRSSHRGARTGSSRKCRDSARIDSAGARIAWFEGPDVNLLSLTRFSGLSRSQRDPTHGSGSVNAAAHDGVPEPSSEQLPLAHSWRR
jgi:hypothetical protein